MKKDKVIDIKDLKGGKKKLKIILEIVKASSESILTDEKIHGMAVLVGLQQGLKYNGSLKNGVKGAALTYGAFIVANSLQNIVVNKDILK